MKNEKLQLIPLQNIRINDTFWNKYIDLVAEQIIPYQWEVLNDRILDAEKSHCIQNFRIAAGLEKGEFHGFVFQDTDAAKWLESVAYSLAYKKDPELEQTADELIELIGKAQQEDGYLNTYFTIKEPELRFTNLREGHELYTAGHMIEAAVAYYKTTGKDTFLNIMRKNADLICEVFHSPKYSNAVPGHQEIELALVSLYEVTNERKYLEMAHEFIERRGTEPNYLVHEHENPQWKSIFQDVNPFQPSYSQCHLPVREQLTAEGHAVRAVYMYSSMADLAYEYKDESLFWACSTLYHNIVTKRMYLTGGIGSSGMYERFSTDYDLPNDSAYAESCASIGLAMFCRRMIQITGDARYADTMETALMNTVLSGIAMDGKRFFYVNPLEVWPDNCIPYTSMNHVKAVRQKWFACACCPPNIARTLSSIGNYAVFQSADSLWVNLYMSGTFRTTTGGCDRTMEITSEMPFAGSVKIEFLQETSKVPDTKKTTLYLRIPQYARNPVIRVNGAVITPFIESGYARVENIETGDQTELFFDMPAEFVYANPQLRENAGKTAVKKGPLVYAAEEVDNGKNLAGIFVDDTKEILEKYDETLLGGTVILEVSGFKTVESDNLDCLYQNSPAQLQPTKIKLVPYCYWGNRLEGEMQVWMKRVKP